MRSWNAGAANEEVQRLAIEASKLLEFDHELQALQQFPHRGVQTTSNSLECKEPNFAFTALKV
jgi:hypothetical protein